MGEHCDALLSDNNELVKIEAIKSVYNLINNSGLFDNNYYLKNYPDDYVMYKDTLLHYILIGWKEGKNPSNKFDTNFYLKNNHDVKLSGINPLVHYIIFGFNEGRKALNNTISSRVRNNKFDVNYYLQNNEEIIFSYLDNKKFVKKRKHKVLICDEKWLYHANENSFVPYNIISYMVDTLNKSGLGIAETFFFDENCKSDEKNCVKLLLDYIDMLNPSLIMINQWRLDYIGNNIEKMKGVKFDLKFFLEEWIDECIFFIEKINKLNIPIIIFWPDIQDWGNYKPRYFAQQLDNYVLFHNIWDIGKTDEFNNKYVFTPTPIDNSIYDHKGVEFTKRENDVCFIGSVRSKPDRKEILTSLNSINIILDIHEDGAFFKKDNYLSHSQCADIYNRSKIAVNFSLSFSGIPQLKGRVFESILCGCLLLEQENSETKKYFTPFEDYIPWINKEDLTKKIKYYLENPKKAEEIAINGYKKAISLYTGFTYWEIIFNEVSKRIIALQNNK
ncbi:MAG: glycosyltransferase family protein [bacterium]